MWSYRETLEWMMEANQIIGYFDGVNRHLNGLEVPADGDVVATMPIKTGSLYLVALRLCQGCRAAS